MALRATRRHGSDVMQQGLDVAAAADRGNPTPASTDAAAGTSASADATAAAGMVHLQQQQQEASAVEHERVRTTTLRSSCTMSTVEEPTDGCSVCHILLGSSSRS